MNNDLINEMMVQFQSLTGPVVKTNKLMVANLEKLVSFQLDSLQGYVNLTVERLKAAAEVQDVKGMQDFVAGQAETLNVVRQKMLDDAKALADMGAGFKAEFDKLAEENAAELNDKVTKLSNTAKKAA
ncbi:MAG: phasin family protein [Candidatus Competibacteraceae bacterium]|nr:phasin family protein [Candidatus Competibacteraceae bacterium]